MQDGDHDALNIPVLGDPSTLAGSLDAGNSKLLVVATLAALILAGSAIVYRTIPLSSSGTDSSSISGQSDAVHKQKKMKMMEPLQGTQKRAERGEGDSGAISYEGRPDVRDANGSLVMPASPSRMTEEFDSKESKSSRSKDRRRRGKDPIKEMLKSEKRSRGFGGASPTLSTKDYTAFIKSSSAKEEHTPSSPSTSLFTDSQLTRNDNGKTAKSKRAAQRENSNSNIGPDDTTTSDRSQQARGNSLGTISGMHSRGTSESISASESTQRQNLVDGLETSTATSQILSSSDYPSNPYTSDPSSSLASDDGLGRPQSSMSASTTSSAGSRQVGNADDQDDVLAWETIRREKPNKRRRASLSQAQRSGLASEDEDTRPHHDPVANPALDSSSVTSSTSISLTSVYQPLKPASRTASSISAATENTTTTGMSSSVVLSSGGMSPATSPSLSHGSVSSVTCATTHGHADETADHIEARDKTGANSSSSHSLASSSASVDTARSSSKSRKGSQKSETGSANNDVHDPWDWDGAGNAPSSSSSNVEEGDRNLSKDKNANKGQTRERDNHQRPPRMQQGGGGAGKVPSFSSVAASRLPTSSTHPNSLYSPTSSSFGQSSGSGITASVSAAPGGGSANVMSPSLGSDSGYSLGELKERDEEEEEAFTFPTLNPTTAVAGSSRTRSSLVDNNNNNNNNSNTTHYNSPSTSRRAPTPRRPPTPARSNGTPPPHASSSSSLNSPTSNGNSMPALSTQTQLASLRGALEAARLREEKNKQDMEKYVKDMDSLRWENAHMKRGEMDLQMQIRHLTHQLHSYAALVASVSPQLQQQQQANATAPSTNPAATGSTPPPSTAPNGTPSGSTSVPATPQLSSASPSGASTHQQQQTPATHTHPTPPPLHIHQMLSNLQMSGLQSPGGVLSPLSMSGSPLVMGMPPPGAPSAFYPYPMPPHPPPHPYMIHTQQIQYMQQQYQQQQGSAQPSPHQANVFSSIFPPGPVPPPLMSPLQQHQYSAYVASQQQAAAPTSTIPYGSRSSSAAGTSSVGSMSPNLNGSPSPGGLNGNRRVRTRTLTANDGRPAWEQEGDGWIGGEEDGQAEPAENEGMNNAGEDDNEDGYSEGGFNEVLADAILKRPGSIRVRSAASKRGSLNTTDREADNEEANSQVLKEKVEVEQLTEFTFPSLSNLGNVLYRSDVIAVNGGLSSSSSSSASPAPPAAFDVVPEASVPMEPIPEVNPAGVDVITTNPGASDVEAGLVEPIPESPELVSVSPESTTTSETTPREEVLASAAEPPTNLTETPIPSEGDPRQSQEIGEANNSPVEH